jgi:hypothetical protein
VSRDGAAARHDPAQGGPGARRLEPVLLAGLAFLTRRQLPTGEIPSYRLGPLGERSYLGSPLASALAHGALAALDPSAAACEPAALGLLPPALGQQAGTAAARIRRRIRAYLAWQEGADGRWSFFGRGSGLLPDAETTAAAAAALIEGSLGPAPSLVGPPAGTTAAATRRSRPERSVAALARHRAPDGRFYTYFDPEGLDPEGRGFSSLGPRGERRGGFDRVVNAHVLRLLALAGEPAPEALAWLLAEAASGAFEAGTPDHPNPLCFAHALARALAEGGLDDRGAGASALVPRLLARQRPEGGFGSPLGTALAATALLDLGYRGESLAGAARALLAAAGEDGAFPAEAYVAQGGGSESLTAALALGALARLAAVAEAELPS